jgi:hypothetical protein
MRFALSLPGRAVRGALLGLLLLTALACQGGGSDIAPPAYGEAKCAACGSLIDQPHFSAQYRLGDGTVKSFDDPACLFEALHAEASTPALIRFHDSTSDAWLDTSAWFARTSATARHGSGWAAYPSFAAAQDAVTSAGNGEILSFEQAKEAVRRSPKP